MDKSHKGNKSPLNNYSAECKVCRGNENKKKSNCILILYFWPF